VESLRETNRGSLVR